MSEPVENNQDRLLSAPVDAMRPDKGPNVASILKKVVPKVRMGMGGRQAGKTRRR